MKKITVSAFSANCLAIVDEVCTKRRTVVITKRGKPVAKLVPVSAGADDIYNFLAGKGRIKGDIIAPVLTIRGGLR